MLARVAESLVLTARSLERASSQARLLEVSHGTALDGPSANGGSLGRVWEPLVQASGDLAQFRRDHVRADARSVAWFLTLSTANPDSVAESVRRARESALGVRDRLTTEVWEAINELHLDLGQWSARRLSRDGVFVFCRSALRGCALVQAMVAEHLIRDDVWQMLRLGTYTERAAGISRALRVGQGNEGNAVAPALLLRWMGAREAYARTGRDESWEAVAGFLAREAMFPRSLRFSLDQVGGCVAALSQSGVLGSRGVSAGIDSARSALEGIDGATSLLAAICHGDAACRDVLAEVTARHFTVVDIDRGGTRYPQAVHQAQN